MTDTANLGLPFIEGSQAQKHVTHNEALRILDAAIQISVLDLTLTAPPAMPAEGARHVVASGATGVWAGQANAIATWQDGAWAFLAPHTGWCIWSVADNAMFVFDGTHWHDLRGLSLDNAAHIGVNTTASSPNLLSVKSNAALLSAINVADGGSGDARLQISKESSAKTASVFFSDAFSGRAEFGLTGSDAFKLKVSADGLAWVDALSVDQSSGNIALSRGVVLAGVITPSQITSNQNDYNPAGLPSAGVMRLSTDASRQLTGIAGGADGRFILLRNVGSFDLVLKDASTSSSAANRFALGTDVTLHGGQGAIFYYDATLSRWLMFSQSGAALKAGTLQIFASGSGTYTVPAGAARIRVRMLGGGGGGSGSATSPGNGGNGGTTTFGSATASGGIGGASGVYGGPGGTASGGTINLAGSGGGSVVVGTVNNTGAYGGCSPLGGVGRTNFNGAADSSAANTGSGGGGGGCGATTNAGAGGGSGGYVEWYIASPSSTYSYAIGAGGSAGTAGTGGFAGGAGGSGVIIIEEYYGT